MVAIFGVGVGSILIAGIVAYAFGWAWHVALASFWQKFVRASKDDVKKMEANNKPGAYVGEFVALLVTAFALGAILNEMAIVGVWAGVGLGALVWLGFVAATTMSMVFWGTQTFRMWIPGNLYRLLALMLMGAIMA